MEMVKTQTQKTNGKRWQAYLAGNGHVLTRCASRVSSSNWTGESRHGVSKSGQTEFSDKFGDAAQLPNVVNRPQP
jgi:predicted heme/steroid binding protein